MIDARPSSTEGLGLFALQDFAPGDPIRRTQIVREITKATPLDPTRDEHPEHCTHLNGKRMLYAYPDRHMNHCCDPNAWYDYSDYETAGAPLVRARHAIARDAEITVDYLINNSGGDSWPCTCGAVAKQA